MISRRSLPLVLLVLSFASAVLATANGVEGTVFPADGKVSGDRVALRAKPEVTSDVLVYTYVDQKVRVLGETGEWYVVELPREYPLWVSKEFVKVGANSEGEVTSDRVNLRAGPGVQYNSEGQLGSRVRIEVLEEKDGWLKFRFKAGDRGYVSRRYVVLAGDTAPRPTKPDTEPEADATIIGAFNKAEEMYRAEVKKDNIADWDLEEAYKLYVAVMDQSRNQSLLSRCRSRLAVIHLARRYRELAKAPAAKVTPGAPDAETDLENAQKRAALAESIQRLFPQCIGVGRIEKLASAWLQPATHKLIREDRVLFLLRSDAVDLTAWEDKFVGIEGEVDTSVRWPIQTVKVTGVVLPPERK